MKVETKAYGLIDVDESQRLTFPQGLFGFENYKDYVLLDAEQQPFYWLQSVDQEHIAFVLVNPFLFRPDYEMNIDNEELLPIGITDPGKAVRELGWTAQKTVADACADSWRWQNANPEGY